MEVQYKSLSHDVVVPLVTVGHFDNPQIGRDKILQCHFWNLSSQVLQLSQLFTKFNHPQIGGNGGVIIPYLGGGKH
jgi:hypothetical protein